jgi:hypothetical protein
MLATGLFLVSLSVVPQATPATTRSFDKATFTVVQDLLKQGKFADAAAVLQPFVAPTDAAPASLYLLSLVHLQAGETDRVPPLIKRLRGYATPDAGGYADKLAGVLASAQQNAALSEQFAESLRRLDADGAREVLARMDLPAEQRGALDVYVDAYRGRLTTALTRLQAPDMQRLPESVRKALRAELVLSANRLQQLSEQLHWYTQSSLASSACQPADARERSVKSELVLAEYVRLTELALQLFPFNHQFMDAAFHGALLSAPYEDLRRLGDDILKAKGDIRIPFYSATAQFVLVIDSRSQRLYTELDRRQPANTHGSDELGAHVLFDLPFRDVSALKQRGKTTLSTGSLAPGSYAVKVEPQGQAPHYLFMTLVHCLYGEETQKQITRNLGLFIQHVVGRQKRIDVQLEDPAKVTKDRLQVFSQIVGAGTMIAAGAAEGLRREPDRNDGRLTMTETLQQTSREGQALMTRRNALLAVQAEIRESQKASSRSWAEARTDDALKRAMETISSRVDELLALVSVE